MTSPYHPLDRAPRGLRLPYDRSDPRRAHRFGVESSDQWRARIRADNQAALLEPLTGIELGNHDSSLVAWLAGWDIPTVAGLACLLHRARAANPIDTTGDES